MAAIPSDNDIRLMLDGAKPAAFDGLFLKAIEAARPLTPLQCLDGRVLTALDGCEPFCSRKITCEQHALGRPSTRGRVDPRVLEALRSDNGTEYYHAFLGETCQKFRPAWPDGMARRGASIDAPGHKQALPLPP
jgi:hypothetical protein